MKEVLYELNESKDKLLVTDFYVDEKKISDYKQEYLHKGSEYWKLYQLETNIDILANGFPDKVTISHCYYDRELEDSKCLPDNFIRVVEKRIVTLYDDIYQDKLINWYLDNDAGKSTSIFSFQTDVFETYKLLSPEKIIYPFQIQNKKINCGGITYMDDLLKVPKELQALDFFLGKEYEALANNPYADFIPWELFEECGQRTMDTVFLERVDEKRKQDLPYTTKLLSLYRNRQKR